LIRLLRPTDLETVMGHKQAAGWNQTQQDWTNLLAIEPEGCWVAEQQGIVTATTTVVCYGQQLAWIGMVLVHPEHRRKGFARALMEHCLAWLQARRVRQVKLDATDMGRPLYEKLGFQVECSIERWSKTLEEPLPPASPSQPLPLAEIASFDKESFGADRTRLMKQLLSCFPGHGAWLQGRGFILGRPGSQSFFLGPCAASDVASARCLITAEMARSQQQRFFWDLFPGNPAAAGLAHELGFERKRELARMSLQPSSIGRPERVFAAAGFEYG